MPRRRRKIKQALYPCWSLSIDIWISTCEIRSNHWLDQPDETAAGGRCRSSFASHSRRTRRYYICFGKNGPLSFHQDTWLPPLVSVVTHRKINSPYFSSFVPVASCEQDTGTPLLLKSLRVSTKHSRISKGANRRNSVLLNLFSLTFPFSLRRVWNATTLTLTSSHKRKFNGSVMSLQFLKLIVFLNNYINHLKLIVFRLCAIRLYAWLPSFSIKFVIRRIIDPCYWLILLFLKIAFCTLRWAIWSSYAPRHLF